MYPKGKDGVSKEFFVMPQTQSPNFLAIFYCEFDAHLGPKIVSQIPSNFTENLPFDSISDYVIPKPDLCNRLLCLQLSNYTIIGYPVHISNQKYSRNALIFNVCFIFDQPNSIYNQLIEKTARMLTTLESSCSFLTEKNNLDSILERLWVDCNYYSECQIRITDEYTLDLKLFPEYTLPGPVYSHQVPIQLIDLFSIIDPDWDLTLLRVIPFINGINHIKKIAAISDVRVDLVVVCVQHLIFYGCCALVDIFQFSNIYVPDNVDALIGDSKAQKECIQFVSRLDFVVKSDQLFRLYASMKMEMTVGEWLDAFGVNESGIDVRRFIVYGCLKGYIRRIHRYPVALEGDLKGLKRYCTGAYNMDELCVLFEKSTRQMESLLHDVIYINK